MTSILDTCSLNLRLNQSIKLTIYAGLLSYVAHLQPGKHRRTLSVPRLVQQCCHPMPSLKTVKDPTLLGFPLNCIVESKSSGLADLQTVAPLLQKSLRPNRPIVVIGILSSTQWRECLVGAGIT